MDTPFHYNSPYSFEDAVFSQFNIPQIGMHHTIDGI